MINTVIIKRKPLTVGLNLRNSSSSVLTPPIDVKGRVVDENGVSGRRSNGNS
jgi:hypothetical protein